MSTPLSKNQGRIQSVDLLRGAVMVLMAIDHVRVYSGMPAGGQTAGIFFTRWVTHFCVPAFVFFAGTSAFLYGVKTANKGSLARFLLTRGILLVLLELVLIRFCWTFNLDFSSFMLAGVIWMIGWCMILLAAFVRLSTLTIGITGLVIAFAQQIFEHVPKLFPESMRNSFAKFWEFFYPSGFDGVEGINILYHIIPWIGVMMAGYAFGSILLRDENIRKKICLSIGLIATVIFVLIASIKIFSGTAPDGAPPALFRILNQQKYPASQLYLLMTLGPIIALIPFAEKVRGWFSKVLVTFGGVPMFYYILHILLIHLTALIVNMILTGATHQEFYATAPYTQMPEEMRWGLPLLYLVFFIDVVILYFMCRFYSTYKLAHPEKKWLSYL